MSFLKRHHIKYLITSVRYARSDKCSTMSAWQLSDYGGLASVALSSATQKPTITHPDDVLIKISAASMNQIDRRMTEGYGRTVVNTLKTLSSLRSRCSFNMEEEFPITLGRDCSGVVEAVGAGVKNVQPGSKVYGAVPVDLPGCHAEYVTTPSDTVALKPDSISHVEAASIPYAAITAYTAIRKVGELSRCGDASGASMNALVIGGSGGVGLSAIQLLRATRGVTVTATCNHDAVELLHSVGAQHVVDYSQGDIWTQIRDAPHASNEYDLVLDLVGHQPYRATEVLRPWACAKYVTVVAPLLPDTDSYGLVPGLAKSASAALYDTLYGLQVGSSYRWAFFMPDGEALTEINELIVEGKFRPVIEQVYKFSEVKSAYERLAQKHLRGKLVVDVADADRHGVNTATA